jgi:hypothetical protein
MTIWAWEPLAEKPRKGKPQPTKKRTEKRWIVLGKLVQDANKEGHQKYKEGYQEVV